MPAHADGFQLETLMAEMKAVRSSSAHFVEKKYDSLLSKPVETSGTLKYVAPGWLERIAAPPRRDYMVVDHDTLSGIQPNGRPFFVTLSDHAEVAALVEGIRSTLAGDLATLRRYYRTAFSGDRNAWQLILTPLSEKVRDKVDLIRISGAGASVKEIDTHEADGDHSDMVVTPDGP
ncbi:MAG TPA: LolA-related protein [Stellaceae bacterium]|nr:LolA-related protein [Stellaceae bacterium]